MYRFSAQMPQRHELRTAAELTDQCLFWGYMMRSACVVPRVLEVFCLEAQFCQITF